MRAGDDADADDFAERLGGGFACLGCGLDSGDIAGDAGGDHRIADLGHGTDELDIGGFQHGVRGFNESDEAAGFDHSECLL